MTAGHSFNFFSKMHCGFEAFLSSAQTDLKSGQKFQHFVISLSVSLPFPLSSSYFAGGWFGPCLILGFKAKGQAQFFIFLFFLNQVESFSTSLNIYSASTPDSLHEMSKHSREQMQLNCMWNFTSEYHPLCHVVQLQHLQCNTICFNEQNIQVNIKSVIFSA